MDSYLKKTNSISKLLKALWPSTFFHWLIIIIPFAFSFIYIYANTSKAYVNSSTFFSDIAEPVITILTLIILLIMK